MNQDVNKSNYRELASSYDSQIKEYDSYGHDVLFGMCYDYVNTGEKLLDIGIGTGLGSIKFSRVGLRIYGLDESQDMLNACQSKSFAAELKRYDINLDTIPYKDQYFDHVISCGVFHFIGDLSDIFTDARRVMKKDGLFAFTIAPQETNMDYIKEPTAWGVSIFKHSPQYIMKLLETNGLELLKEQRLLIKGADKVNYDMLFSVLICRSVKVAQKEQVI